MGFETQEEAESWAENAMFLAKQRKEERLLASARTTSQDTLDAIVKSLEGHIVSPREAVQAAYTLGQFDGKLEMSKVGLSMVEKAMK